MLKKTRPVRVKILIFDQKPIKSNLHRLVQTSIERTLTERGTLVVDIPLVIGDDNQDATFLPDDVLKKIIRKHKNMFN